MNKTVTRDFLRSFTVLVCPLATLTDSALLIRGFLYPNRAEVRIKERTEKCRLVMKLELSFKNGRNASYKSWTSALKNGKVSLRHKVTFPFFKTLVQDLNDVFLPFFHERV